MTIDYEKLKIAHELASKLPYSSYSFDCWCCSGIESGYFYVLTFEDDQSITHEYESECIDDLITKLRDLTKPVAKYKDGDLVWFIHGGDQIKSARIAHSCRWEKAITYKFEDFIPKSEDELYPTKQSLIEAKIAYWNSLLATECLFQHGHSDCQHEPMSTETHIDEGGCFNVHKCGKCGVSYK